MTSIRKRTWATPDGTQKQAWQVDYRDQAGGRRSKQFSRKKDAEQWLVGAASEVQKGIHTPDSVSITVAQAAQIWLEAIRAAGREPTTIAAYDQHIRLHIVPVCGARKLSQLTAPEVKRLLDHWLKALSRSMALRVLRSLKAILNEAQERGLVAQNVAIAVKPRTVSRERGKVEIPTKAELRTILKAAEDTDDLMGRAILELAMFTGLRASELRGLSWRTVDLNKAIVRVEQRADAHATLGAPKSVTSHRTIPLPARVVSVLKKWKIACKPTSEDFVFPSQRGKAVSYRILMKNHVGPILITAGVSKRVAVRSEGETCHELRPRYTMHDFRHAAASLWIENGLHAKRIQTLMGHSSIQMTFDTYGHLFDQHSNNANDAAAIERALFADAT
jgi:integrase